MAKKVSFEENNIEEMLRKIYTRLGWVLFWVVLIALCVGGSSY